MSEEIIDISMEISPEMPVYKGRENKKPVFTNLSNHEKGEIYETVIKMNLHTGTHVDAPLHMLEGGKDSDVFEPMIIECEVLDLAEVEEKITVDELNKFNIEKDDFILLKTRNSELKGTQNFIYLAESGTDYLVNKEIKGVGIDSLGIERAQPGHPTHKKLLSNNITLIEGLELGEVAPGNYKLIYMPLNLKGVEAVPLKAVLLDI